MSSEDRLVVPYGVADWTPGKAGAGSAPPMVEIDRRRGLPLRLNNMDWKFPTPPDPLGLATTTERLDYLRSHLKSLCGLWDRLPRLFLDLYFGAIEATIEANRSELHAALGPSAGLFDVRDWSFSAFCPLPQAHLPLRRYDDATRVRVDVAFWTGVGLVAVELVGATTHGRARRAGLDRLRQGGVELIEISSQTLERADLAEIERALGPLLDGFWRGERFPSSPFRPASLEAILSTGRSSS